MIEARVGDGTYVRAPSELAALLARRVQRARLNEAVEVRAALEKQAAHLAAQRRTTEEVTRLRELLARQQAAVDTGDRAAYTLADEASKMEHSGFCRRGRPSWTFGGDTGHQ